MNDFLIKMLQLGGELEKSASPLQTSMIINDAEILYKKHFTELSKICPSCGCNKMTGDGSKSWCLNKKCDFVESN